MALYVAQATGDERQYHVGDRRLMSEELLEGSDEGLPVMVSADGDELEHIARNFTGIPFRLHDRRLQTWTGEMARFIVENW